MVPIIAALSSVASAASTINSFLSLYPPFVTWRARATYNLTPNMLPDLSSLAMMLWRGTITEDDYYQKARETGFDRPLAEAYQRTLRQLLTPRDYVALWRRGVIDVSTRDDLLHRSGLLEEDIAHLVAGTEYFPPPPDLIRFAVREVYNDETRKAFGQDEDISPRYITEAAKAGLGEEQARNYWASHWELPSINQGFDMLHRHVIPRERLEMLLKALDVMPFWRDALLQISYNPLTRVDIRRMHAMGILSPADVQLRYEAEGFSPADAALMTQFTVAYNTREETGTSQSKVVEAYKKDIITTEQLTALLTEQHMSAEAIQLLVRTADFDKALDSAEQLKSDLFGRYTNGEITIDQVRQGMTETGVPASYVTSVMAELGRKVSSRTKLPSKDDLTRWLELDLISEEDYKLRMQQLGYRESDVLLYLAERILKGGEPKTKYLANTVYQGWLRRGMISVETFTSIMLGKGLRNEDIAILIAEAKPQ